MHKGVNEQVAAALAAASGSCVEALSAACVNVLDADEYQPSFDEVFAELVERRRAERREQAGERTA